MNKAKIVWSLLKAKVNMSQKVFFKHELLFALGPCFSVMSNFLCKHLKCKINICSTVTVVFREQKSLVQVGSYCRLVFRLLFFLIEETATTFPKMKVKYWILTCKKDGKFLYKTVCIESPQYGLIMWNFGPECLKKMWDCIRYS